MRGAERVPAGECRIEWRLSSIGNVVWLERQAIERGIKATQAPFVAFSMETRQIRTPLLFRCFTRRDEVPPFRLCRHVRESGVWGLARKSNLCLQRLILRQVEFQQIFRWARPFCRYDFTNALERPAKAHGERNVPARPYFTIIPASHSVVSGNGRLRR